MAKVSGSAQHLLMTGKSMPLGEVAEVTFAHPPLIGDAVVDNGGGLMLVIEKFPSANTLEVTRGVDQALAELGRGLPGVKIDSSVFRLAAYIGEGMTNLAWALAAGALLAVLVLGAFLHHWRVALVSVIAIPLSLVAALLALALAGATFNTMMLAGLVLALAVLIDDATVDAERVMQRLRAGDGARPRVGGDERVAGLVRRTLLETRRVALYGALIVALAVTPVFFIGGVSGAFFEPLAIAFLLAVAASMLVALTVTPALALLLLRNPGELRTPAIAAWLEVRYERLLRRIVEQRNRVFIAAGAVVALGLGLAPLLGQSLLPALKERQLQVNVATAPGTSYAETYRITSRLSRELRGLPGVRNVGAHVGRAVTGDQVVGINSSQIWISIDRKADHAAVLAAIRETIDGYPGIERNVQSYLRDKVSEVLTGAGNAIVVRLYGPNREVLAQKDRKSVVQGKR